MEQYSKSFLLERQAVTAQAGTVLGRLVQPGDVLALVGDLGAGKTSFTRSLAYGMGIEQEHSVCSPTFTIINEYPGRLPLYHIDLYRIGDEDEAWDLGLDEYFFGQGVCAVEWFDRFAALQPPDTLTIRLDFLDDEPEGRKLTVLALSPRSIELAQEWTSAMSRELG